MHPAKQTPETQVSAAGTLTVSVARLTPELVPQLGVLPQAGGTPPLAVSSVGTVLSFLSDQLSARTDYQTWWLQWATRQATVIINVPGKGKSRPVFLRVWTLNIPDSSSGSPQGQSYFHNNIMMLAFFFPL